MASFINVGPATKLPIGTAKLIETDGQEIALFNVDGSFHAKNRQHVHHFGAPLHEATIRLLGTLPWHGRALCHHRETLALRWVATFRVITWRFWH